MTPAESSALLRRLATNRDTFTEWVISRAETQAVLELVRERDETMKRLYHALVGVALSGVNDDEGLPSSLQAWCDEGWTCEHAECVEAREAMFQAEQLTQAAIRARAQEEEMTDKNSSRHRAVDHATDVASPPDPYLHTTLHGVKVKVLLDD